MRSRRARPRRAPQTRSLPPRPRRQARRPAWSGGSGRATITSWPLLPGPGPEATAAPTIAHEAVQRALGSREPVLIESVEDGSTPGATLATLRLGEPPLGALQLLFAQPPDPAGP